METLIQITFGSIYGNCMTCEKLFRLPHGPFLGLNVIVGHTSVYLGGDNCSISYDTRSGRYAVEISRVEQRYTHTKEYWEREFAQYAKAGWVVRGNIKSFIEYISG